MSRYENIFCYRLMNTYLPSVPYSIIQRFQSSKKSMTNEQHALIIPNPNHTHSIPHWFSRAAIESDAIVILMTALMILNISRVNKNLPLPIAIRIVWSNLIIQIVIVVIQTMITKLRHGLSSSQTIGFFRRRLQQQKLYAKSNPNITKLRSC